MGKLSMCRICLAENVRMCVVTDKSLQETYEKLTDVPFVTEDRRPMLACFFCCTRLKQCCQLQRKCVEAEELLAQMLSDDYEKKPLLNREQLGFFGGYITTPVENISIVDDCQIGSDAIKQELPAVCEEQDDVEIELPHLSEELIPENVYNSHPNVEAHHSSEPHEYQCGMEIKIELAEEHEQTDKLDLQNPDKSYPGVEDIPARDSGSDSEDNVPLVEIKIEAEEGPGVSKQGVSANQKLEPDNLYNCHPDVEAHYSESESEEKQLVMKIKVEEEELSEKIRDRETQRASVEKKSTLKRKLEDILPAKQKMNVLSDSKNIRKPKPNTSDTVAKTKTSIISASQSGFSQSSNLIQHTRIHNDANPFTCDICQRSFSNQSNFSKHIGSHTVEKPFKCDVCQRNFTKSYHLKRHVRIHSEVNCYKCDVCHKMYTCKNSFIIHFRKHSVENPFKCDVCQQSFSSISTLNRHVQVHSGEKPYKCDVCPRSFITKPQLKIHSRIHTGEKPYKCGVCQRTFNQMSNLIKHSRIHSNEKPFKCDVCLRSFNQSAHLKQHIRVHTGEKPYKCEVCQKTFSLMSNLTVHLRKHTGEKPFKCDVCQRSLTSKRGLEEHLRKKHGIE